MKPNRLSAVAVLALASAGFALSGCATISMQAQVRSVPEPLPSAPRLPLRVGILVSDQTQAFQTVAKVPLGQWTFPFGRDLATVCRQSLAEVFDRVDLVNFSDYQAYDLIVEPSFDGAATRVDISMSQTHVVVGLNFTASNASGAQWRKSVTGEVTTGGRMEDMAGDGQAVSKAVKAAALAMRSELGASAPQKQSPSTAPAGQNWWQK